MRQRSALVVLGLLAVGERHGYDLEQIIQRKNVRLWAKIGMSTIYKALHDLQRQGCVTARAAQPARGAGREVFTITDLGRRRLAELTAEAFRSQASVYSDRIAAMALAAGLPYAEFAADHAWAIKGNEVALARLDDAEKQNNDPMALIVIDFYKDVMAAERRALEKAKAVYKAKP